MLGFFSGDFIIIVSVEDDVLRFDEVMEVLIGSLFEFLDAQFSNSIFADDAVEDLSSDNDSSMSSSFSSLSLDNASSSSLNASNYRRSTWLLQIPSPQHVSNATSIRCKCSGCDPNTGAYFGKHFNVFFK